MAPNIVLNGTNIPNKKEPITLKKIDEDLLIKRMELLELLKKLKKEIEYRNEEKTQEYKNSLNKETVIKTLKK